MNNYLKAVLVVVVLGAITWAGLTYPKALHSVGVASPVATTFNDAKVAVINFNPLAAPATTTSILNTDATDRIIVSAFSYCQGMGTSGSPGGTGVIPAVTLQAATTSTAAPVNISTLTNFVFNTTIATSTVVTGNTVLPSQYQASTTPPVLGDIGRIWKAGSYLTFFVNATNTAACQVGVTYLGS